MPCTFVLRTALRVPHEFLLMFLMLVVLVVLVLLYRIGRCLGRSVWGLGRGLLFWKSEETRIIIIGVEKKKLRLLCRNQYTINTHSLQKREERIPTIRPIKPQHSTLHSPQSILHSYRDPMDCHSYTLS